MIVPLLFNLLFNYLSITARAKSSCWDVSLFSSKTAYKIAAGTHEKPIRPSKSCKPLQINMIHRHGNRYPSAKDTRNMKTMATNINAAVRTISPDIPLKLPWKCPFSESQDKVLSSLGERELYSIGKNIKHYFPELFRTKYSPLVYKFQSSCKLRCTHSSNSLAAGLFEFSGTIGDYKYQPIAIETLPCDDDPILRFFDVCPKYIVEVDDNKTALHEMDQFDKGNEVKRVLQKVSKILGNKDIMLKVQDLKSILIACAYDVGMFNGSSGICSLFDDEDFSVMEYSYDLKHFYKRSAGYEITYDSSCLLLKDIIDSLKSAVINQSDSYVGVFRSAHAETIMPLYAILGLFIDNETPTAVNYKDLKKRAFRPACISPFSGNIYFILYSCVDGIYRIQLYVNERLTRIPCCDSAVDCEFEVFLKCYQRSVDGCHFKKLCQLNRNRTEL